MFAHLQVHMQMENHYSSAHKGATYKVVHIYGIFQQRSNSSSELSSVALGAGLGVWGAINLLEGYGNDNPGANAHVQ